jgi:peptidoglycan/LPS O-acetylase OafA/YrhL
MPDWSASPLPYRLAAALAFPPACATGVLAYLGLANRLLRTRHSVLDGLSSNAYGIYLVHYVFVLWLQYALIGAALSAISKASLVLSVALVLSWATSAGVKAVGKSVTKSVTKAFANSGGKAINAPARRPATIASEGPIADQTR